MTFFFNLWRSIFNSILKYFSPLSYTNDISVMYTFSEVTEAFSTVFQFFQKNKKFCFSYTLFTLPLNLPRLKLCQSSWYCLSVTDFFLRIFSL